MFDRLHARALVAAVVLTAASSTSALADAWKDKGGDCDNGAFKDPEEAGLDDIAKCTKLWEAYRTDLKPVKGDYKKRVIAAMTRLYAGGSDADAKLAGGALERLGVSDLPKRSAAASKPKAPPRKTFAPPAPDKKQVAAAEKEFKAGMGAYKKKDYAKAATHYVKMTELAPGHAKGHYNAACVYALLEDEENMAKYLMNLRDLAGGGDKAAQDMVGMVKKDTDFDGMRDESSEYKRIMGYAKVLIINDLGDDGAENADNLQGSLDELGYKTETKESDKKPLKKPHIFYAPHARTQAYIIKEVVTHPKVVTKEMSYEDLKGFDVVVQWSDEVKKGDPKIYVKDPEEAEKKLDELSEKQEEMLSKPEDAVDELDEALGKPADVQERIQENLDRPGEAVEKVEKTLDKIKSPFK
ncbi:MAG: hypothetical protein IT385_22540 [Deltaproteobacteria bacterium]|nr:hypothetical protein [Deltaproteobacteria bacterium]